MTGPKLTNQRNRMKVRQARGYTLISTARKEILERRVLVPEGGQVSFAKVADGRMERDYEVIARVIAKD